MCSDGQVRWSFCPGGQRPFLGRVGPPGNLPQGLPGHFWPLSRCLLTSTRLCTPQPRTATSQGHQGRSQRPCKGHPPGEVTRSHGQEGVHLQPCHVLLMFSHHPFKLIQAQLHHMSLFLVSFAVRSCRCLNISIESSVNVPLTLPKHLCANEPLSPPPSTVPEEVCVCKYTKAHTWNKTWS